MARLFSRRAARAKNEPPEVELKDRGNQFLADGRLDKAEACFRQAIAANADYAIGYLNLGFVLSERGQRDEAEHALARAVALDSQQADAWYILGTIAQARGEYEIANERFARGLKTNPRLEVAYRNLVESLMAIGRRDEAKQTLRQAIAVDARWANFHLALGELLMQEGAYGEAADHFRIEAQIQPELADAEFRLATALQCMGDLDGALAACRAALAVAPAWPEAHQRLGDVYRAVGELERAVECYRRAVDAAPERASAHVMLGIALRECGEIDAAIESFVIALALSPDLAQAHCELGSALHLRGDDDRAIEEFKCALELHKDYGAAHYNMGVVLLKRGDVQSAVDCFHEALKIDPGHVQANLNLGNAYHTLGDAASAIRSYRRSMTADLKGQTVLRAHSNLIFTMSSLGDSGAHDYLAEVRRFGAVVSAAARPYREWLREPPERSLRVGFVSGDLRFHPVGFFLENVLARLAARNISPIAYSTVVDEDSTTSRLKRHFTSWNVIANMSDAAAARKIHDDRIDVLIDLAGHTANNGLPLFAWKPAPVQASWLGYWASTGVAEVDYFIGDPVSIPPERHTDFTETIWYLPDTRFCFTPPGGVASLAVRPPPAVRNGFVTYGSFQNVAKMTDETLALWGRILRERPDARLRLQDKHLDYPGARDRLHGRLADFGVARERVAIQGRLPRGEYLDSYAEVDIVLDTTPFSGGTTTCEAIWMGVPTVTLVGQTLVTRQGASILTCVGLKDWIAGDEETYVAMAQGHAACVEALAALRNTLRARARESSLFNADRFAAQLAYALHGMVRRKRGTAPNTELH